MPNSRTLPTEIGLGVRFLRASDEALLARVARGDRDAFAAFYDLHASRVLALLLRRCRDRAEAEDALQETFSVVWARANQFDAQRGSAIAWLFRIASSRSVDQVRRRSKAASESAIIDQPAKGVGVDENVEQTDLASQAFGALARIGGIQEELIRLAFLDGWTHEQIAERRKLPLGTVKTHIRRGMQELRALLAGNRREEVA